MLPATARPRSPRPASRQGSHTRLLLAVLLLALGCGDAGARPNILLVTLDTTRADHLGTYGYFRDTSPTFDALARESIVFERAIVPMATTLPTHLSLLTASYPIEHGVLANVGQGGRRFLPSPSLHSFATVARNAGYHSAAFVGAAPLKRGTGIENGFTHFNQPVTFERRARQTTQAALRWLSRLQERPFLLWVHYFDAHWPFAPPAPYDRMYQTDAALEAHLAELRIQDAVARELAGSVEEARVAINGYDGEIRYQDDQLRRLLDALRASGDWERTAVLVLGDHGEGLGQHGVAAHGGTWDEQIRAPMLIRVPGVPAQRVPGPVSIVDAIPTLVGLLGEPALARFKQGTSGRDALAASRQDTGVFSQDTGRRRDAAYRYALTSERWKYFRIENREGPPGEELYDLHRDPHELEDVAAAHPEVAARLGAELQAQREAQQARARRLRGDVRPRLGEADPELLRELRALGYVAAGEEDAGE